MHNERKISLWSAARVLALAALCLVAVKATATAQQKLGAPPTQAAPASKPAPSPAGIARPATPALPAPETMLALVRTHLLALDHALHTGNFTVLHALSGPYLQGRLTPDHLAQVFRNLRSERPDLVAAAIRTPTLAAAPAFTKNGMLWLKGSLPAEPKEIRFEMVFEVFNAEWRLAGLDVGTAAIENVKMPATLKPTLTR